MNLRSNRSNPTRPSIRYVGFHTPGPRWQHGLDFREQGKLELGGPFLLQEAGGMMVAKKEVSQEELEAFASADPAVEAGLLRYEVRPWLTAMEHI